MSAADDLAPGEDAGRRDSRDTRIIRVVSARISLRQRFRDIWRYRELLVGLTQKELKVKYKNSILGFVWSLLNPALYLVVFYVVFQLILKSGIPNFAIYLLAGLLPWTLFSTALSAEWTRRVTFTSAAIRADTSTPLGVLLGPEPGKGAVSRIEVDRDREGPARPHLVRNENMHLTLVQRSGLVGWALMMWVIGSALAAIRRGAGAVADRRLGLVLWAIFSSGVGFLVSMSNFNALYDSTIQVFFWSLLGIGMAIAVHQSGRRPTFNVIWRFGPGD